MKGDGSSILPHSLYRVVNKSVVELNGILIPAAYALSKGKSTFRSPSNLDSFKRTCSVNAVLFQMHPECFHYLTTEQSVFVYKVYHKYESSRRVYFKISKHSITIKI